MAQAVGKLALPRGATLRLLRALLLARRRLLRRGFGGGTRGLLSRRRALLWGRIGLGSGLARRGLRHRAAATLLAFLPRRATRFERLALLGQQRHRLVQRHVVHHRAA